VREFEIKHEEIFKNELDDGSESLFMLSQVWKEEIVIIRRVETHYESVEVALAFRTYDDVL
jgi:hypothetical protein